MEPTKIVENLYLGNIQNGIHHSNYGFDKIIILQDLTINMAYQLFG